MEGWRVRRECEGAETAARAAARRRTSSQRMRLGSAESARMRPHASASRIDSARDRKAQGGSGAVGRSACAVRPGVGVQTGAGAGAPPSTEPSVSSSQRSTRPTKPTPKPTESSRPEPTLLPKPETVDS